MCPDSTFMGHAGKVHREAGHGGRAGVFNEDNVGFARACNQGIRMGEGAYCLLLNPDAVIDGASLQGLVASMEGHSEPGLVAPRLVYPDGSLQLSVRRFPTLRAIGLRILRLDGLFPGPVDRYLMRDWDHEEGRDVDWVIGACMLLRRKAVEEVGLLDEGFFMYYEDIDLCYRMGQQGWGGCATSPGLRCGTSTSETALLGCPTGWPGCICGAWCVCLGNTGFRGGRVVANPPQPFT
jgi:GT2 family glycosyltransferase